jgi:hypothetical protein
MKTSRSASAFLAQSEQFWMRAAPPHALAIFRIAFGAYLLFYWGLKAPHVPVLFSEEGIAIPRFAWTVLTPPPAEIAWVVYGAFLLSLAALTLGFAARPAASVACALSLYYRLLSVHLFGTSFDRLYIFALAVLAFSGADRTFSLAMLRKRGSIFAWEKISILPQRILAAQLTATYLGVGLQKLFLPSWQGGEILAYGFTGRWATPLSRWIMRQNWPMQVFDAAVFLVKAFEISLPIGLWIPRVQWLFFLGTALFHTAIALTLGIWWFLILVPANVVFLEPERFLALLRRVFPQIRAPNAA